MEFYQKTFGGELQVMTADQAGSNLPPGMDPKSVMHSSLKTPAFLLMASDNDKSDTTVGDNVCIYLDCSDPAEVDTLFAKLAAGGESSMKPEKTFWGAYFGSLTDAYGISWMLSANF